MTEEEKQRMIHIRLGAELHRELRRAAAEYDVTLQEIVAKAVEERVHAIEAEMELEQKSLELEEKARELEQQMREKLEPLHAKLESELASREKDCEDSEEALITVTARLDEIEGKLQVILDEVSRIQSLVGDDESN